MQLLDVDQIRAWDEYTIRHEPIPSLHLMERAAHSCFHWLMNNGYEDRSFSIFCGKGNNGGDGLALARLILQRGLSVSVYILESGSKNSPDFQANLTRLRELSSSIHFIPEPSVIPSLPVDTVIIDALFGSGLNKPLDGSAALLAEHLNGSGNEIISIDLPSGLFANKSSVGNTVIKANKVLSFQCYKLAFMMAENAQWIGQVYILDIGLHPGFLQTISPGHLLLENSLIKTFFKKRGLFAHKGNFGHAALVAGSYGMMGAVELAAGACMRSGVGKLTCHIPACGYTIMQLAVPEAMCITEEGADHIESISSLEKYEAVAIGPGLGLRKSNVELLENCFRQHSKPMVLDADALNTIAEWPGLLTLVPQGSILTPHVKEFERLFGKSNNDFDRIQIAIEKANALQLVIVLKGHHTFIAAPGRRSFFNTTGNPGMAKAGNGDLLTGMLLAFLAQGYTPLQSTCLAVFLHGRAADLAVTEMAFEALLPSDCLQHIGSCIKELY